MPKFPWIERVLLIGSGPIVIGQACEFDYSGTQALKAMQKEGVEAILVNPNPATIMTDRRFSKAVYIEPLTVEFLEAIIAREKPQAILPTMGGQTALNLALRLAQEGVLERHGVRLIGAREEAIQKAEDRKLFSQAMQRIGLRVPQSVCVKSLEEGRSALAVTGLPAVLRPSFTLGGAGGSVVYNVEEFEQQLARGLAISPVHSVLVERSVAGWKEFELEVMRDRVDNVVIVCSIENLDPMGVHTGDSVTVAPAQTLCDVDYQKMRQAALAIMREIGVDTGGSNIQFAVNPADGEMVIIEMNPRVSRSSALASKATGFPIAKIATLLALGYTLDEIPNDITSATPASFEPVIDYVVTKIPRFDFVKFRQADDLLGTSMKSVGEVMAIGRTFRESLQKAIRSLENGRCGFGRRSLPAPLQAVCRGRDPEAQRRCLEQLGRAIAVPSSYRLFALAEALRAGMAVEEAQRLSAVDPWFLEQIRLLVAGEEALRRGAVHLYGLDEETLRQYKAQGYSDARLGELFDVDEETVRRLRQQRKVEAGFKTVDTCSAEFAAATPYLYSSYDRPEAGPLPGDNKVVILGSGPNRIGQGIEFDSCCVEASLALRQLGYQTIMVNCNPETVSTDFDISDRLYFEPLTFEDVMNIVQQERPLGTIVQLGGQTPLKLAGRLQKAGVKILGTAQEMIDVAEDRGKFRLLLEELGLHQPPSGTAGTLKEAQNLAQAIGYPVLVRPSYVLGGRGMEIVYDEGQLQQYFARAKEANPEHPVLIDRYLENATEIDVDAVADGDTVFIGGVMEHIEEAGIHSGDSCCILPPQNLGADVVMRIRRASEAIARRLQVRGLINFQYALYGNELYVLEVNPRASRTVPFVAKATGVPMVELAVRAMVGQALAPHLPKRDFMSMEQVAVKAPVFPFARFAKVDPMLGPEMKSTGEVMGLDSSFPLAFYKAQLASFNPLPAAGTLFFSVHDRDKAEALPIAKKMQENGFSILATTGTARLLAAAGIRVEEVKKVREGRPHIVDRIKSGEVQLIVNTTIGRSGRSDSYEIRRSAVELGIPYFTTLRAARAAAFAIAAAKHQPFQVRSLPA